MVKIYRVDEGGSVDHWVLARNPMMAVEFVKLHILQQMDGEYEELTPFEEPEGKPFTINLEGIRITHTPEEWAAIYDNQPRYMACSEY